MWYLVNEAVGGAVEFTSQFRIEFARMLEFNRGRVLLGVGEEERPEHGMQARLAGIQSNSSTVFGNGILTSAEATEQ